MRRVKPFVTIQLCKKNFKSQEKVIKKPLDKKAWFRYIGAIQSSGHEVRAVVAAEMSHGALHSTDVVFQTSSASRKFRSFLKSLLLGQRGALAHASPCGAVEDR